MTRETQVIHQRKLGQATRDAYGLALKELGEKDQNIIVLDADLSKSTKTATFGDCFPERFTNCGIMEANMVGVAAGLALSGKIVFVSSFACFLTCKSYDQFRMSIANPKANVKIVASHGGISVGEDGASQHSIEDIALMTSLPEFSVMIPADQYAAKKLVIQSAYKQGPVYIRTCRPKAYIIYDEQTPIEIGKSILIRDGKDVTIIANGLMVHEALLAAETLEKEGIDAAVVDMHTLKPIDDAMLKQQAIKTGAFVTAEEHQIWGGLGSIVSQSVAKSHPVPIEFVAIQDTYAESGNQEELFKHYGLSYQNIVNSAKKVISRKT
ncbi:MAG: transketolase family protein [Chlamydiota bacterium]|nr:transketolase family protein [Chlamydiota bacterium]